MKQHAKKEHTKNMKYLFISSILFGSHSRFGNEAIAGKK